MRVVVAELHRPTTEAGAENEGHSNKTGKAGKRHNKPAKVGKKEGPGGTPLADVFDGRQGKQNKPDEPLDVAKVEPGKKSPPKESFSFREVRGAGPPVKYFARYLWPKAQFFEFQFKDVDTDNRHDTAALRDFVINMQDAKFPFVRYPLVFLTFSQYHITDGRRGCFAAGKQDVFNVQKASNLNRIGPPKQAKYSKLLFTQFDQPICELADVALDILPDVTRNAFTFTDGCGTISPDLMEELMQFYGNTTTGCAVQCRLPGIKGVLAVDATLPPRTVRIRPSMIKLDVLSVLAHSKATPESSARRFPLLPIVVLTTNTDTVRHCGNLNDQIVSLLLQRGVPASVFENLTRQYIDSVKYMGLDCRYAVQFYNLTGRDATKLKIECASQPAASLQPSSHIKTLHRNLLQAQASAKASLKNAKKRERLKIPVADSRLLLGVCDHTASLGPGECFLQLDDGKTKTVVRGAVAVTRNPCYHPGDIRVLRAVACPGLMHLTNVVVFSVQGGRPAPDEMAGGDLDGDVFFAMWDRQLVPPTHPVGVDLTPAFDYTVESVRSLIHRWAARHPSVKRHMAWSQRDKKVTMHHVVDYLVRGGSTQVVAQVDTLLQQLLALPPSSVRTEWTNVLNAMFVCGIDHVADVVDVDAMVATIQRKVHQRAAEVREAAAAPSTMDTMSGLLAHVRSLDTAEATPPGLALTMFASSLAKIDRPVAATDFENLSRLFLWAVLDVLSAVERQVLTDATIPDEFAVHFQPQLVRQVVELLEIEDKTLRRKHDALRRRPDIQTLGHVRHLRSDLDAATHEVTTLREQKITQECVRRSLVAMVREDELKLARLQAAVQAAKTPPYWHFSWFSGSWQPSREAQDEIATNEAVIQSTTTELATLQRSLRGVEDKLRQADAAAAALDLSAAQTTALLEEQVAILTPDKEEELLKSIRDIQHHVHLRDQFVQVCTALATAASHRPTDVALLNECLVAEVHMFEAKLPVYAHRTSLVAHAAASSMHLVVSETGSGKSTCLPQFYLTESIMRGAVSSAKRFCVVVPRRAAAKNLAKYMASMRKAAVGDTVGYHVGTTSATKSDRCAHKTKTLLECVSGGIILGKAISDPWFGQFAVIFVDEVHEESADLYLLLGKLKAARSHHPMLRVVFMSAKVDEARLQAFFGTEMPVETIEGRSHPVTSIHQSSQVDYMGAVIDNVLAIHEASPMREFPDILVFLPRICDVEDAVGRIQDKLMTTNGVRNLVPLALHSRVDEAAKAVVLKPTPTNTAGPAPPPGHNGQDPDPSGDLTTKIPSTKPAKGKVVTPPFVTNTAGPAPPPGQNGQLPAPSDSQATKKPSKKAAKLKATATPVVPTPTNTAGPAPPPGQSGQVPAPSDSQATKKPSKKTAKMTATAPPVVPPRRVIFATNIAEASLTIPGVGYVIDSGLEVVVSRDIFCGATVFSVRFIAQTSVVQRKGRCGREGPGTCHHLYSDGELQAFGTTKRATYAELEHIVLRLVASDSNPFEFDWFEHPGVKQLQFCVDLLVRFRMIDTDESVWRVTAVGKEASKLLRLGLDINSVQLLLVARESDVCDGGPDRVEEGGDLVEKVAIVIACVEFSAPFRHCKLKDADDVDWDSSSVSDNFVTLFYAYTASKSKKEWAKRLDVPLHAFVSIDRRQNEIGKQMQRLGRDAGVPRRRTWAQCVAAAYPTTRLKIVRFKGIGPEFAMVDTTVQSDKTIRLSRDEIGWQRLEWDADKTYVALLVTSSAANPSALFAKFVEEVDDSAIENSTLPVSHT